MRFFFDDCCFIFFVSTLCSLADRHNAQTIKASRWCFHLRLDAGGNVEFPPAVIPQHLGFPSVYSSRGVISRPSWSPKSRYFVCVLFARRKAKAPTFRRPQSASVESSARGIISRRRRKRQEAKLNACKDNCNEWSGGRSRSGRNSGWRFTDHGRRRVDPCRCYLSLQVSSCKLSATLNRPPRKTRRSPPCSRTSTVCPSFRYWDSVLYTHASHCWNSSRRCFFPRASAPPPIRLY